MKPRRISRTARFGLAAILALLMAALLWVGISFSTDGGAAPMLAIGAVSAGLIFGALLVGNVGFRPRVQGQYLDVITVIGRQSLDLAALTGVRWERARGGTTLLRLRDQITEVVITLPPPPAVRVAVREGLATAAQRGVVLPRRVSAIFGLPEMPGAPRDRSYSKVPLLLGFLAFSACLGLIAGLLL